MKIIFIMAALLAAGAEMRGEEVILPAPLPRLATVFLAEDPREIRGGKFEASAVRSMVDSLVMAAAGR